MLCCCRILQERMPHHMPRPLPGPGPPAAPAAAFALARAATARPLPPTPVATFFACTYVTHTLRRLLRDRQSPTPTCAVKWVTEVHACGASMVMLMEICYRTVECSFLPERGAHFVLWINALEHWRILQHVGNDHEADATAPKKDVVKVRDPSILQFKREDHNHLHKPQPLRF